MAFRSFDQAALSRRSLLRGAAWAGTATALAGLPFVSASATQQIVRFPNVAALLERYVGGRKVANMVAGLGFGQAPPEFLQRGGLALGPSAPAGPDSLYRIYSMTKPITGMAVMTLIDDGMLGLDQPLAEILPAFANMQVQKTYDGSITDLEPAERPITIRHLLTHTAGLGYTIIQQGPIKRAYEAAGLIPGQVTKLPLGEIFGRGTPTTSLAAFADGLAKQPLVYQPGTRWSYSVSLDLLGRVIEVVTGKPFAAVLQERFFDPLGMDSTFFRVPESELGRLTTNYGIVNGVLLPLDPPGNSIFTDEPAFPFGGAGLVSTPRDYDRFLQMLVGYGKVDGKRVMGELAVRVGTSNLMPEEVPPSEGFLPIDAFGAGGFVGTGARKGAYGWGGAAGTTAFCDMRTGLRATLFTQYMPVNALPISGEFLQALAKDLALLT